METTFHPSDLPFLDALTYAATRREYVDFFLQKTETEPVSPMRAFIDRISGSGDAIQIALTNGSILKPAEIQKIVVYFPEDNASESISCLCQ